MSKYANFKRKDLPHVFVTYQAGPTREDDKFSYGVVGKIPISQLVGYIIRVQAELAFRNPEPCDDVACVITFNPQTNTMDWFVHKSIPVDALVGTLEIIKCSLLDFQIAALTGAAQTGLVNSSGKPITKEGLYGN